MSVTPSSVSRVPLLVHPPVPDASPWLGWGGVPYRIHGVDLQAVEFLLPEHSRLVFQPNTFICGAGIDQLHISWGNSILDPFRRTWSGEKAVLQQVVPQGQPAQVYIGGMQIGRVIPILVTPTRPVICQRGAFLAGLGDLTISVAFTRRMRAGLFGKQGLVFQRVTGNGVLFVHAAGVVVDWTLPDDRVVRVSTNNILAFDATVGYDVQFSGGVMALMFGGQGAFLSQLQGPGRVLVQSIDQNTLLKHATPDIGIFGTADTSATATSRGA